MCKGVAWTPVSGFSRARCCMELPKNFVFKTNFPTKVNQLLPLSATEPDPWHPKLNMWGAGSMLRWVMGCLKATQIVTPALVTIDIVRVEQGVQGRTCGAGQVAGVQGHEG